MWKLDLQKEVSALYRVDLLSWLALSQMQSIHFSVTAINECIYLIHLTNMNQVPIICYGKFFLKEVARETQFKVLGDRVSDFKQGGRGRSPLKGGHLSKNSNI